MATDVLVALVTCPPRAAGKLAGGLVADGVAACVNVVKGVDSWYRWQGKVQHDSESMLVIKTSRRRFGALKKAVLERHPYELPEVIAVPVERGHAPYLDWVINNSKPSR